MFYSFSKSSLIELNSSNANSRFSMISVAITSGSGRFSTSHDFCSLMRIYQDVISRIGISSCIFKPLKKICAIRMATYALESVIDFVFM